MTQQKGLEMSLHPINSMQRASQTSAKTIFYNHFTPDIRDMRLVSWT
jgi:hypothetical protein